MRERENKRIIYVTRDRERWRKRRLVGGEINIKKRGRMICDRA